MKDYINNHSGQLLVSDKCEGVSSIDTYFKVKNLFKELVSEYDKAQARFNLGISDTYTMKWGNIQGVIEEQKDLADYFIKSTNKQKEEILAYFKDLEANLDNIIQEKINDLTLEADEIKRSIDTINSAIDELQEQINTLSDNTQNSLDKKLEWKQLTNEEYSNLSDKYSNVLYVIED